MEDILKKVDIRMRIFGELLGVVTKLEGISNVFLDDLTTKQWFLLLNLSTFYTSPPTLTQIARQMGVSHQNIKLLAMQLVKKQYITLVRDEKDKRMQRLVMSEKFAAFSNAHHQEHMAFIMTMFSDYTVSQWELFERMLLQMTDRVAHAHSQQKENAHGKEKK